MQCRTRAGAPQLGAAALLQPPTAPGEPRGPSPPQDAPRAGPRSRAPAPAPRALCPGQGRGQPWLPQGDLLRLTVRTMKRALAERRRPRGAARRSQRQAPSRSRSSSQRPGLAAAGGSRPLPFATARPWGRRRSPRRSAAGAGRRGSRGSASSSRARQRGDPGLRLPAGAAQAAPGAGGGAESPAQRRGCGGRGRRRRRRPLLSRWRSHPSSKLRGCGSCRTPAPAAPRAPGSRKRRSAGASAPGTPPSAPRPAQSGRRRHGPLRELQALASDACATPSRCCRGLDSAGISGEEAAGDRRAASAAPLCPRSVPGSGEGPRGGGGRRWGEPGRGPAGCLGPSRRAGAGER